MSKLKVVGWIGLGVIALAGATLGFLAWWNSGNTAPSAIPSAASGSALVANNTNQAPSPQAQGIDMAQPNQNQPSSNDFAQYDKYKSSKNVLMGDIKKGSGATADRGKMVAIGYKGYLTSGQIFDQTTTKAFSFQVGGPGVIPGMSIGVNGMKVGGQRRIIIPPALGYGSQKNGPIPANSVLIFDVELLAVK